MDESTDEQTDGRTAGWMHPATHQAYCRCVHYMYIYICVCMYTYHTYICIHKDIGFYAPFSLSPLKIMRRRSTFQGQRARDMRFPPHGGTSLRGS